MAWFNQDGADGVPVVQPVRLDAIESVFDREGWLYERDADVLSAVFDDWRMLVFEAENACTIGMRVNTDMSPEAALTPAVQWATAFNDEGIAITAAVGTVDFEDDPRVCVTFEYSYPVTVELSAAQLQDSVTAVVPMLVEAANSLQAAFAPGVDDAE